MLILEEPDVLEMRSADVRDAAVPAIAGFIAAPTQDEQGAGLLPAALVRPPRLQAVLPGVEYGVVAASALADNWGVAGAGVGAARVLRDKAEQRKVAGRAQIPQPEWLLVSDYHEIEKFRTQHGSCVIKPTDRQGSLGVLLLGPDDDVRQAWREVTSVVEPGGLRSRDRLSGSRYLAEERVSGAEISVTVLVAKGRLQFANVTAKDVLPGRYPIELGHTVPAPISGSVAAQVIQYTDDFLSAVEFQYGMAHAEWIVGDSGPRLMECAARIPGDGIVALIEFSYGARLLDELISIMEGGSTSGLGRPGLGASIRFIAAEPGVVTDISGVDDAWDVDDIVAVNIGVTKGSEVRPLRSSLDRVGSVIAVAPSAGEAKDAAVQAAAAVRVTTRRG